MELAPVRVYVAGSFNNIEMCREAGGLLRDAGLLTYVFCDEGCEAFSYSKAIREAKLIGNFTPMTALNDERIQSIYKINMEELDKSHAIVMILPCGKSSHMEAGYLKGFKRGAMDGQLIIYGEMKRGEFDAMYGMADLVTDDFHKVIDKLLAFINERKVWYDIHTR